MTSSPTSNDKEQDENDWKGIPLAGDASVIIGSDRPIFLLITSTKEGIWAGHLTIPDDETDEEIQHLITTSTNRDEIVVWAEEHIDSVDGISIPVGQ